MSNGEVCYTSYWFSKVPNSQSGSMHESWTAESDEEKMAWESGAAAAIVNNANAPDVPNLG